MKCPECGSEDIRAVIWGEYHEEMVVLICPDRHEVMFLGMSDLRDVMEWAIHKGFNFGWGNQMY